MKSKKVVTLHGGFTPTAGVDLSPDAERELLVHNFERIFNSLSAQKRNKLLKIELTRKQREQDRLEVGIVPRPVLRCGIPLQKPASDYLVHASRDGNCTLKVKADPEFGMPFGRDLITPLWLFSSAYEQASRTVRFKSGREILRSLGMNEDGRSFRWLIGSIERNFGATWEFTITQEMFGRLRCDRYWFRLVDKATLWFTPDRQIDFSAPGFQNEITLTEHAYELAQKRGYQAKIELDIVARLAHSPGATRLFLLLRDRSTQVPDGKPYCWIPLSGAQGLDVEMGVKPYAHQPAWRQFLRGWLEEIRQHWPESPTPDDIQQGRDGHWRLMVRRARPVGSRLYRGSRAASTRLQSPVESD